VELPEQFGDPRLFQQRRYGRCRRETTAQKKRTQTSLTGLYYNGK
jgi:hypothetical protein